MARENTYNFSAGPSVLPESALIKARDELLDFGGSGISVMEMSHRSTMFQDIFDSTVYRLKELMNVPESHEVLFLQGGASTQFAAIPMNLMQGQSADYAITGNFAAKAAQEAKKYGILMSLHAPYFISLSGVEPEKRLKSIDYIQKSL